MQAIAEAADPPTDGRLAVTAQCNDGAGAEAPAPPTQTYYCATIYRRAVTRIEWLAPFTVKRTRYTPAANVSLPAARSVNGTA